MPAIIEEPACIEADGNKSKRIKEYFGRVCANTSTVSITYMDNPEEWVKPTQTLEFDEYTLVTDGTLMAEVSGSEYQINSGQAILISSGETVRYSSPTSEGAKYVAVCLSAYSPLNG
jgi:ethanolamine utilization protein EutQ (cupin superfamily)